MKPIRLVLYDDHPIVTEAIQECLSKFNNLKVLKTFSVINDFLKFVKSNEVDVIITDILSSEEIGISLITQIKKHNKKSKLIAFSAISSSFIIQALIDAGADAFISKSPDFEILYNTIIEVHLKIQDTKQYCKVSCKTYNQRKTHHSVTKRRKISKRNLRNHQYFGKHY
ncbi:MAG: response regulator transcription factor [Saprospiraceae bacterium]|nr:response regulator transcription factor [Saprospiraceae bacterium]